VLKPRVGWTTSFGLFGLFGLLVERSFLGLSFARSFLGGRRFMVCLGGPSLGSASRYSMGSLQGFLNDGSSRTMRINACLSCFCAESVNHDGMVQQKTIDPQSHMGVKC
jgi:hypothetical protein